jgi:hypothetical protein
MLHKQRYQWMFAVLSMAAVAAGTITLLRQGRETLFGISIPSEIHLALFLIGEILLMVYVFHQASRVMEAEIEFAAARKALWFIKTGVAARPSADESELAYELRVAIEFVRFGMKAIEQPVVPRDQVQRAKVSLQETLDSLETARHILQRGFPFG